MSTPSDTPETDAEDRPYPSPEHAQRIRFEGNECVVMYPEEYEALYEKARKLERERDEARRLSGILTTAVQAIMAKLPTDGLEFVASVLAQFNERDQLRARVEELEKALILAEDELGQTNEHLINRIAEGELVTIWQSDVEKTLELIRNTRLGRQAIDAAMKGQQ